MGGVDHRFDDARVFCHAVNIDFDRQHAGVERRLAHQLQHVFKGVVRVVKQHVVLANGVKPVAEFFEPGMAQARQRFVDQVGLADVRKTDEVFEVMVTAAGNDRIIVGNTELAAQQFHHFIGHVALINKAHRLCSQALLQAGRHQFQQAGFHLGNQIVFRIAGHFHRIGVERVVIEEALEDVVQAVAKNVIQQDHRLAATRGFRRQVDEARYLVGRDLQQRIIDAYAANNLHRQIGVIVFQELHQVGFIVDQDRRDVLAQMMFKVLPQPDLLVFRHLAFVDQEDLVACHFQQQIVIQAVEFLIGF
ncbi:hypothetical protein D3C78_1096000 [compost metagenome]